MLKFSLNAAFLFVTLLCVALANFSHDQSVRALVAEMEDANDRASAAHWNEVFAMEERVRQLNWTNRELRGRLEQWDASMQRVEVDVAYILNQMDEFADAGEGR